MPRRPPAASVPPPARSLRLPAACLLAWAATACAALPGPPPDEFASLPLPHCHPAMDEAGYWLAQTLEPDRVLLAPDAVSELNRAIREQGLLADVFSDRLWDYRNVVMVRPEQDHDEGEWAPNRGEEDGPGRLEAYTLYTFLKHETERIKARPRFDAEGNTVPAERFRELDGLLGMESITEGAPVRYAMSRRRTDVRFYPTGQLMTAEPFDTAFDVLQVSSLRGGSPVAVLHASRDGRWAFVVTSYCRGWVRRDDLLEGCSPEGLRAWQAAPRHLVVSGHRVAAAWQPGDTPSAQALYLGSRWPWLGAEGDYHRIALPVATDRGQVVRRTAYVPRSPDVTVDSPPLTTRALLTLGFRRLHEPYGWGGQGTYRDCSQLMQDLFAVFGLHLPRNSSVQGLAGRRRVEIGREPEAKAELRRILDRLDRPVLLQFPGHIMLYLGREGGRYYVLHAIWAYRKPYLPDQDRKVVIGKVVVSDLSLGEGSLRGSLFDRITTVNWLEP